MSDTIDKMIAGGIWVKLDKNQGHLFKVIFEDALIVAGRVDDARSGMPREMHKHIVRDRYFTDDGKTFDSLRDAKKHALTLARLTLYDQGFR